MMQNKENEHERECELEKGRLVQSNGQGWSWVETLQCSRLLLEMFHRKVAVLRNFQQNPNLALV